jgi:hypothetical protein
MYHQRFHVARGNWVWLRCGNSDQDAQVPEALMWTFQSTAKTGVLYGVVSAFICVRWPSLITVPADRDQCAGLN